MARYLCISNRIYAYSGWAQMRWKAGFGSRVELGTFFVLQAFSITEGNGRDRRSDEVDMRYHSSREMVFVTADMAFHGGCMLINMIFRSKEGFQFFHRGIELQPSFALGDGVSFHLNS